MLKAVLAAGALVLVAGCNSSTASSVSPADATMQELVSKLAPVMSCARPYAAKMAGSVRADCDGGKAFVEAFPDGAVLRLELERTADISVGQDYLVGDTWLALADDPGQMGRMKVHLGGQVQHVGPTPTG